MISWRALDIIRRTMLRTLAHTRAHARMPLICTVISMLVLALCGALGFISWLLESTASNDIAQTTRAAQATSDRTWVVWAMGILCGQVTILATVLGGTSLLRRREPPTYDDEALAIASGLQRIMVQQHPNYSKNERVGKGV